GRRLLRARRERPSGHAAEQRDELAPFHSITSLATESSVGGIVRPSALAVLRLITSYTRLDWVSASGKFGFTSMPIATAFGTISCNNSSRFASSSPEIGVMPVAFPPGRLRLATRPCLTGSPPPVKTIGIVAAAALAGGRGPGPSGAPIPVLGRRTKSAARPGSRS